MKVSKILEIISLSMPPQFRAHWQKREDSLQMRSRLAAARPEARTASFAADHDAQLVPNLTRDPLYRQIIQEILDTYLAGDADKEQLRSASDCLSGIYADMHRATRILAVVYEADA
jgi:hypothetical protein